MKATRRLIHRFKYATALALTVTAAAYLCPTALADDDHDRDHKSNPLYIKGYQVYTNVGFVDPANPTILQVRTGGEGGVSHLGKMRSWSTDQQGDLVTGALTAHYAFQDKDGDKLLLQAGGSSSIQADGRITFAGSFTVTGGTGRFKKATGILHFEGWARTTDFATGVGIGFGTIEGVVENTKIDSDPPIVSLSKGIGTISADGQDFVYEGNGVANGIENFRERAQSTPGPFHSAFVGIIGGRFVLSSAFDSVWTDRHGDKLKFSGIEFISFELVMVGGMPNPDLSKPSTPETYYTVEGGTGDFKHARGVLFGKGSFNPTSPNTVAAELRSVGFLSDSDHD